MDILVAVVAVAVGLLTLFMGFRLFLVLLPFWGLLVGFAAGAQSVAYIVGEGFLQGLLGVLVGALVGIVFAAIAIVWWWAGVVIAIAGMGFAVGYAMLPAVGVDLSLLNFLLGIALAGVFALAAVVLELPRMLVIGATSLWGAGATLGGVLIIIGELGRDDLGYGSVTAVVATSMLWFVAYLALAIVGMVAQSVTSGDVALEPPAHPRPA